MLLRSLIAFLVHENTGIITIQYDPVHHIRVRPVPLFDDFGVICSTRVADRAQISTVFQFLGVVY